MSQIRKRHLPSCKSVVLNFYSSQLLKLSVLLAISAFAYKNLDKVKYYFAPPKKPVQEEEAVRYLFLDSISDGADQPQKV